MEIDCCKTTLAPVVSTLSNFDEEFPNLEALPSSSQRSKSLLENDLGYAKYRNIWWPIVCRKVYAKKISVIYINCEQKAPICIPVGKLKRHSDFDHTLFWEQKDMMPGLREAMLMVDSFRANATKLNMSALQFFSQDIAEQKKIFGKIFENEIIADATKADSMDNPNLPAEPSASVSTEPSASVSTEPSASVSTEPSASVSTESSALERKCRTPESQTTPPSKRRKSNPIISEKTLSAREQQKLKSAEKVRSTKFKSMLKFMRSAACLSHLTLVAKGVFASKLHDQFVEQASATPRFLEQHLKQNVSGLAFFSINDVDEHKSYVSFLQEKLACKKVLKFCNSDSKRIMYIILVLVPEAIKEALRKKRKISDEEELDHILKNGLNETATEQKARRILFELDF